MLAPPLGCGGATVPESRTVSTYSAASLLGPSSSGVTTAAMSGLNGTPRLSLISSAAEGSLRNQFISSAAASGCSVAALIAQYDDGSSATPLVSVSVGGGRMIVVPAPLYAPIRLL